MSNDCTTNGPWRLLILDQDPHDPKWIVATVTTPGDVQPALTGPIGAALAGETGQWLRGLLGHPAHLTPLHRPQVWLIDGRPA
jgi:hypothetical protein